MTSASDARAGEWLARARKGLDKTKLGPRADEIGRVEQIGDGVARISGLPSLQLDEIMLFDNGALGFAHSLDENGVNCVLVDPAETIEAGDSVLGSGDVLRAPVGPGLLGRVIDPFGRPLDGGAPIEPERHDPIDRPAPAIIDRDFVTQPAHTGVLIVDALFALGRGQRELIIGDRAIGKTTLAIDAIISQKNSDMICVYVAIGQKSSSVRRAIDAIFARGASERCIVVVAGSASPPGLQWIAPFAGFTMAEYFRDRGQHALVVVDDLTKHAACHREIALLTRQPPGREAFPGDIFHVHARLLERAAKLSAAKGGGSLTALPIAETDAGNLSAYIPTNLISITDGQVVLDARLFHEGQKPAVDVGVSVSRVGGKTQARGLREAAASLRLDYAQFLELEMFTRFGGLPDSRVRAPRASCARIRAIFNQTRHEPLRLSEEVGLLTALQSGLLDALPVDRLPAFRATLGDALDRDAAKAVAQMERAGALDGPLAEEFRAALAHHAQVAAAAPTEAA